jgi:hypothetical protein
MAHEVPVLYTEAIVKRAAWYFLWRFVRRDVVIGSILVILGLVAVLLWNLEWPHLVILAGLGVALIVIMTWLGLSITRGSLARFRALGNPTVAWRFSEDTFATKSDLGSAETKWEIISEVWQCPGVWLLFFGKWGGGYTCLPTQGLSPEVQDYILSHIRAHRGRVT